MRVISFAWTTPALLAGRKTCTRRPWKGSYAQSFHVGDLLRAYDRSPRVGGKPVAELRLTRAPYQEPYPPPGDWRAEGFDYLTEIGATVNGFTPIELWEDWETEGTRGLWVVRFEMRGVLV